MRVLVLVFPADDPLPMAVSAQLARLRPLGLATVYALADPAAGDVAGLAELLTEEAPRVYGPEWPRPDL